MHWENRHHAPVLAPRFAQSRQTAPPRPGGRPPDPQHQLPPIPGHRWRRADDRRLGRQLQDGPRGRRRGTKPGRPIFRGCPHTAPRCGAAPNPPVPATSPPTPPTVKVGNPFMIAPKTYIEWGQVNPPNFQLYVAAVTGSFPSNTVTWGSALTAPGGSTFVLAEQLASRFYFSSAPATLYAAYCP